MKKENVKKSVMITALALLCALIWNRTLVILDSTNNRKLEQEIAPYLVKSSTYKGIDLSADGARFEAEFEIEIFSEQKGWKQIPLLPAEVAVTKSDLPRGVYLYMADGMYSLLTKRDGKIRAQLDFSTKTTESGGIYSVNFKKVPSVTCDLDVTVLGKAIDVEILDSQSKNIKQTDESIRVMAALPVESEVNIVWEKAVSTGETVPTRLYSETKTLVSIADGILFGQTQVLFNILHTATRKLEMNVPDKVSILEVNGTQIRDWRVSEGKLSIQLEKEILGSYVVDIKYETPLPGGSGKTALPIITGSGVKRDKGHIGVVALTTIEVKGDKTEGAHTIDARDLPPEILGMTTQPVLLAYRYVQPDFNIGLNIGKHEDIDVLLTVIDRSHITIMQTLDGRRIARAVYNVKNNRNQFLRLTMPENAEVWSVAVAGKSIQPAIDNDGRLLLPLVRSVGKGGMSTFPVEIIYAENGVKPDDKGRGEEHIDMPICSEPVMHMMVSLYVPDQGKYSSFEGTLRNVERFTHIDQAYDNMPVNASEQVLRQAVNIKIREHTGEQPGEYRLDINLPISGKSYQFEKILVVKDPQWLSYKYKNLVY